MLREFQGFFADTTTESSFSSFSTSSSSRSTGQEDCLKMPSSFEGEKRSSPSLVISSPRCNLLFHSGVSSIFEVLSMVWCCTESWESDKALEARRGIVEESCVFLALGGDCGRALRLEGLRSDNAAFSFKRAMPREERGLRKLPLLLLLRMLCAR